jgi:hypothetical protein
MKPFRENADRHTRYLRDRRQLRHPPSG